MKVLIVKMSSMGDVVHTLSAVSDLKSYRPDAQIDWVVEEAFVDIVSAHPGIRQAIPVAIRRWRKSWFSNLAEILRFRKRLRDVEYDVIVDAQGLFKSALTSRLARGPVSGLDRESAREPMASLFYNSRHRVARKQHAVHRLRQLFSAVFGYDEKELPLDYGLDRGNPDIEQPRLMFLHGTTWPSKEWPEERWCELAAKAIDKGYFILVPHGNEEERLRAQKIVDSCSDRHAAVVLSPGSIARLMTEMQHCTGIVSVDTGPGHLATAINIPMIGIYGSTDPILTSPHGELQDSIVSDHLQCIPCLRRNCKFQRTKDCAKIHPPCYENITADMVLNRLTILINSQEKHDSA